MSKKFIRKKTKKVENVTERVMVTGLWVHDREEGEDYLSGKVLDSITINSGDIVQVMVNENPKSERSPEYFLMVIKNPKI